MGRTIITLSEDIWRISGYEAFAFSAIGYCWLACLCECFQNALSALSTLWRRVSCALFCVVNTACNHARLPHVALLTTLVMSAHIWSLFCILCWCSDFGFRALDPIYVVHSTNPLMPECQALHIIFNTVSLYVETIAGGHVVRNISIHIEHVYMNCIVHVLYTVGFHLLTCTLFQ